MTEAALEPVVEPDLPIIDPHHHLWDEPPFAHLKPYPIEALAADRAASGHDVRATVFAECHWSYLTDGPEHLRPIGETRWVNAWAETAARTGGALSGLAAGIVGHADMRLGARVEEVLLAHLAEAPARFRGIRHLTAWSAETDIFPGEVSEGMLRSPAFIEALGRLAGLDLSLDVHPTFAQLEDAAGLARAVPEARIVLNHAGFPMGTGVFQGRSAEVFEIWKRGMQQVASCPNICVKLGGLLTRFSGLAPPQTGGSLSSSQVVEAVGRYIIPIIDLVGPDRCMFESNFPVDRGYVTYRNLWNGFKRLAAGHSRSEREAMFFATAARVYRLDGWT